MKQKNPLLIPIIGIVLVIIVFFAITYTVQSSDTPAPQGVHAQLQGDVQVIKMAVNGVDYEPAAFTVKQGVPVRWIIDGNKASGCTRYLISQQLGVSTKITPGENIVEFMPPKKGTYRFSCSMNMASGTISVV